MDLVLAVYHATRRFPEDEKYGLASQLRRAAVSVPSNIVEGKGRASDKELLQFFANARGSIYEVQTQTHWPTDWAIWINSKAVNFQKMLCAWDNW
jgi:four helix bundle protein